MQMKKFAEVFPGPWPAVAGAVKSLRAGLFGKVPSIDPVDIGDVAVPEDVLREIRDKNLLRVQDKISVEEMTADDSPFQTDSFFDDQLVEVLASISDRYHPIDFVRQMVKFIEIFLSESAAFRPALVVSRIKDEDADLVVEIVRAAVEAAHDEDTRKTLLLLLVDVANGGDADWAEALSTNGKEYLAFAMKEVG